MAKWFIIESENNHNMRLWEVESMAWAGDRLSMLRLERDNLIDRWKSDKNTEKAKILVRIMDLEDDIARVMSQSKTKGFKNIH